MCSSWCTGTLYESLYNFNCYVVALMDTCVCLCINVCVQFVWMSSEPYAVCKLIDKSYMKLSCAEQSTARWTWPTRNCSTPPTTAWPLTQTARTVGAVCSVYYGLMVYVRCCHGVMGANACECESEGHTCMPTDQLASGLSGG